MTPLLLQVDGTPGLRHGQAGVGIVLRTTTGQIMRWHMATMPAQTCNEAEYQALIVGLRVALAHQPCPHLVVLTDSQIIVEHMAGRCRVRSVGLHPLHATACDLVTRCGSVRFVHVPRIVNRVADALAWEALGGTGALLQAMRRGEMSDVGRRTCRGGDPASAIIRDGGNQPPPIMANGTTTVILITQ